MDEYEDPFKLFEFDITLSRAAIATPAIDSNDDIVKGVYAAYNLPQLGVYPHTRFELLLAAGELARIRAGLMLAELEVRAIKLMLRRLQDEHKIVSLVYGGEA